jgi:hypothetical protein
MIPTLKKQRALSRQSFEEEDTFEPSRIRSDLAE